MLFQVSTVGTRAVDPAIERKTAVLLTVYLKIYMQFSLMVHFVHNSDEVYRQFN